MADDLAVLISIPYVLYRLSKIKKIFSVIYPVVDAIAVLISIPCMLYTPSMSEKFFNGVYIVFDALAVLIKFHMCYIHLL